MATVVAPAANWPSIRGGTNCHLASASRAAWSSRGIDWLARDGDTSPLVAMLTSVTTVPDISALRAGTGYNGSTRRITLGGTKAADVDGALAGLCAHVAITHAHVTRAVSRSVFHIGATLARHTSTAPVAGANADRTAVV